MRIKEEYREETVINKSRFIACLLPTRTEEEAREFIDSIRKEFTDATHVCTAYMLGPNQSIQRSSDNHEPAGTAGVPMLEAIKKSGIEDITACVVRYFGGIKLGAGGLIRAYSGSVSNAIAHAKKVEDVVYQKYRIQYPYEMSGSLETWLRRNTEIDEFLYDEKVTCYFLSNNPDITKKIQDITKGRIEPVYLQDVKKETDITE